jgi:hypothetical protein
LFQGSGGICGGALKAAGQFTFWSYEMLNAAAMGSVIIGLIDC